MTATELTEIIACGETSKVQFKELLDNKDSIAAEMVAMANADGGQILFGIKDKTGDVCGLNFNNDGLWEISETALQELVQNALTHRDYSINAPVRVFIFDNRIEIISPGCLPNSLTIENIKLGNAVVRNNLLVSYASKLMFYKGLGSGIVRALKLQPNIEFENDKSSELFKVTIGRH